ncbi:hypothetical protein PR202_ga04096 [Eleusine coracana subsp. coracana]|uniref:Uncharacterized protein n=1 Tax=Eleusine coracana subsp. coracana TaxID=191504 RepID=A0AAV5BQB2_ELECO|nr:hypothetical protein PR202_ga04096 [Eleusine coracana subsp. coracana]
MAAAISSPRRVLALGGDEKSLEWLLRRSWGYGRGWEVVGGGERAQSAVAGEKQRRRGKNECEREIRAGERRKRGMESVKTPSLSDSGDGGPRLQRCVALPALALAPALPGRRRCAVMAEPVMKAAICYLMLCQYTIGLLLSDRKQAVKISISGAQAFREYYPSIHDDRTILECGWVKDKFFLHEKMKGSCQETENEDQRSCGPETTIQYETLGLANKEALFVNYIAIFAAKFSETKTLEETNSLGKQPDPLLVEHPDKVNHCSDAGASSTERQPENENNAARSLGTLSTPASSVTRLDVKPVTKKRVALIAVGKPKVTATPSETKLSEVNKKQRLDVAPYSAVESGELFRKLQDSDNANNSLF